MIRRSTVFGILLVCSLLLLPGQTTAVGPNAVRAAQLTNQQLGFLKHIDHIVFVVLENHAYDSEFGTYCLTTGPVCPVAARGIPSATCVSENPANLSARCVHPYNFTRANWTLPDLWHNSVEANASWNNGSMNGFYLHENATCLPCGTIEPFGHYNGSTVPIFWDLAQMYSLNDNFFSSVLSYSLPNHWHIVAGQAPAISLTYNPGNLHILNNPSAHVRAILAADRTYLNQSNHTRSIEDLLLGSNVSWSYYDGLLATYSNAVRVRMNANGTIGAIGPAYRLWNPQAAKAESYNASFVSHFVPTANFFRDARNGTLPALSWVIPPQQASDHPPMNSTAAQSWLASVVDAFGRSPEWNSSAMFITWDDYGGFWDHVAPPTYRGGQMGFRVPVIEISPYTHRGGVSHSFGYFESVLRLMEWRFGLGCMTVLDCQAPLPLWGFDFGASPRSPVMFDTSVAESSYPMVPASIPNGPYYPPATWTATDTAPGVD